MISRIISIMGQRQYFLFLLPLFFIIHGYNERFGYLTVKVIFITLVLVLIATFSLYIFFRFLYKNDRKAAIISFVVILYILTFGSIHDFLKEISNDGIMSRYSLILPASILLFGFLIYTFRLTSGKFKKTYEFLNILLIVLLSIELLTLTYKILNPPTLLDNRFSVFNEFKQTATSAKLEKPDIFFLVFDAMPSSKAMHKEWDFDNSHLDSFLINEGFYVAADAKSNYNITMLSVTSCLNMEYLLPEHIFTGGETQMIEKASGSLLKNSTTEILKKEGYHISQYQPLSVNNKQWKNRLFFENLITNHYWLKTFPGRLYSDLGWHVGNNSFIKRLKNTALKKNHYSHKENFNYTIEQIKKSCSPLGTPKFVYGHFMIPHGPYIFDSSGLMIVDNNNFDNEIKEESLFVNQVKYTNKVIKELVLEIKGKNRHNTIIIIHGDHGYRNIFGNHYMTFDNLNAIYFPDADYAQFNPSQSPINTFRYVFRKFFGAKFPLLKDSSSFIPYDLKSKN